MDFAYPANWYSSLDFLTAQTVTQISIFLPRLFGALLVLIIGAFIARLLKSIAVRVLSAIHLSKWVKDTPIEHFVNNAEFGQKIEVVLGSILYWLIMLIVLHTSVSILGLEPISQVLSRLLNYLPNVISAILVLFFGTLLAGVIESVVKASIKTIDGRSARLLGKVASYLVISITIMAAISELGIAREFIMVLFIGLVTMLSLGVALAVGLGGQDVVRKILNNWYERTMKEVKE